MNDPSNQPESDPRPDPTPEQHSTPAPAAREPRRRWLQFGLRSLLGLTLVAAVACWWYVQPERLHEALAGGALVLDRQVKRDNKDIPVNAGDWQLADADGRRLVDGRYFGDRAYGTWIYYYPGGARLMSGDCKAGQREGLWTAWHEDGSKQSETNYVADVPRGEAIEWWPATPTETDNAPAAAPRPAKGASSKGAGPLRSQGSYRDGLRDGSWTYWHATGQKRASGLFVAGREEGTWQYWDESGAPQPPREFIAGREVRDVAAAVAHWSAALGGEDAAARAEAAWALGRLGRPGAEFLLQSIAAGDADVRARSAAALGESDISHDTTTGDVSTGDNTIRHKMIQALIAALADDEDRVRMAAATSLAAIGPPAAAAKGALSRIAGQATPQMRERALVAWAAIDPADRQPVRFLLGIDVPEGAAAGSQPAGLDEAPRVSVHFSSWPSVVVYGTAIADDPAANWGSFPLDRRIEPALADALADPNETLAVRAATALRCLAPSASVSLPALLAALGDRRAKVRAAAAAALAARSLVNDAHRDNVIRALTPLADDPDPAVSAAAQDTLDKWQGVGGGSGAGSGVF
jgi:antitoxin component YwqK of YwqJK toxin-antitoxin module/HEAT repeat protein